MSHATRINLLHIVLEMDVGGLQRLIADTTLAMDRERFNVEVVCLDELGVFAEQLRAQGIRVTLLRRKDQHLLRYPLRLARFMREHGTHVAHMHPGSFIFGVLAAKLARVPASIYTEHGRNSTEDPKRLREDRVSGLLVDRIIAVSHELEQYLAASVHMPARKISTVLNGIPVERFGGGARPAGLLAEFGLAADTPIVGTVARLDAIKDQLTMLHAFALMRERVPRAQLLLVGDGPMRVELEAAIARLGLTGAVTITGQRRDIPDLLRLFDVFLLSSQREGTSISLLEAMASGVAPVVTKVGGNPAVVRDGIDGLLVPAADPAALAEAAASLLLDPAKRQRLADSAKARVRETFSMDAMVRAYVRIYDEALLSKRRSRHLVPAVAR